jgi:hypothetical protein
MEEMKILLLASETDGKTMRPQASENKGLEDIRDADDIPLRGVKYFLKLPNCLKE